jgi:hypothetical protein
MIFIEVWARQQLFVVNLLILLENRRCAPLAQSILMKFVIDFVPQVDLGAEGALVYECNFKTYATAPKTCFPHFPSIATSSSNLIGLLR